MSKKYIAVEGCILTGAAGSFNIITLPSFKSFINNKGIYAGSLSFTVSGAETGSGTIYPTSESTFDDNNSVLREGDQTTITVAISGGGSRTATITISTANQTDIVSD